MAQINKSSDYFNTVTYTGTGSSMNITGVGFQPDWTWIKPRSVADNHVLFDSVRGVTKRLVSNSTSAEVTVSDMITSFDSDGFSLGTNSNVSGSGRTFVGWNWLASNTTASNTDGSITSTVSANTTNGFSIVSWTGTGDGTPASSGTLGHGLGSAPKMIIVKNRTDGTNWPVYHAGNTSAPETEIIYLNLTNATADDNNFWNDTAPTSSVFTVAGDNSVNGNGDSMIAYCFAEKKGFSKFGSYTGNGSADGTFVYTGFKPAFVLIKVTSTTNDWEIHDNKRGSSNVINAILQPNVSDAESTSGREIDFLSNGFKLRNSGSQNNLSGGTFIYMAFAESPLVGTNNIPATAR